MTETMKSTRDSIKALDTRQQCRDKLSIFYGSRDNYYHGFIETLMNSNDEITNNFENGVVVVKVHDDLKTIEVLDSGRGIPLMGETDGTPNYKLLFETLFAGTNYENLEHGKLTTGANGVGATVLNYSSTLYEVTSFKNGKAYSVKYKDGGDFQGYIVEECDRSNKHGTLVKFALDKEVYTNTLYNIEEIKGILNRLAGSSHTIKFILNYKEETIEYSYKDSLDYMTNNIASKIGDFIEFKEKKYEEKIKDVVNNRELIEENYIKAVISLSTEPLQQTFLNCTYLKEKGTIHEGIVDGLRKFFNRGVKKNKITSQDIEMSFNFYCSIMSTNVEFSNQTKFSTNKALYKKIASDYIAENMEIVKIEQPKVFEALLKHLTMINSFNTKNEETIKNIKKKLTEKVGGIGNRVEGLVDCRIHGEESELFICEGQSALSTCVLSRNADNQAIIAVRGKILSCLKVGYDRIFQSDIIMDIIKVLGCGVQIKIKGVTDIPTFNIKNLRFHKIILTADQDPDGATICCLLLTMFWRLCPYLVENGYIYIAKTPLFEITYEDGTLHYAFSDKEKEELLKGRDLRKCKIQRNKGLGELEAETMARTTMNPKTRVIERVVVEDVGKMVETFEKWFATEVTNRKEHITENLHKYARDLD